MSHGLQLIWKIAGGCIGGVAVLVGAAFAIGAGLPERHRASRSVVVKASPATVWRKLADLGSWASWNQVVKEVRTEDTPGGKKIHHVKDLNGDTPMEVIETIPDRRVVTRIIDDGKPFGGTWTWELEPAHPGTRVAVTEDGHVHNPLFRFVSRYVFGHYRTIDAYLAEVSREFDAGASETVRAASR